MRVLFSTSSPTLVVDLIGEKWYLVLICISLITDIEHSFMSLGHVYVLCGEIRVQVLCPFFNCIVFLCWVVLVLLCILEMNSLSDVSLANTFSHSVDYLFCWWFPLLCKTCFRKAVPFVYFFFCFPCPRRYMRKNIAEKCQILLPMFASRIFVFLHLNP